jgi:hypothetical protein
MTHLEKPVFLIARADKWLIDAESGAALAFGTREEANDHAAAIADAEGSDPALFRVVGYEFAQKVYTVRATPAALSI